MYWSCLPTELTEEVDLDAARLLGELPGRDVAALESMQCSQQADGERAGRAQARSRRGCRPCWRSRCRARSPCIRSASRMIGCRTSSICVDAFELGVLEEVVVDERAVDGDVAVPVDRRRDHERRPLAVVRRQVGATAADRDAQRRPGDQHGREATAASRVLPSTGAGRSDRGGRSSVKEPSASLTSRRCPFRLWNSRDRRSTSGRRARGRASRHPRTRTSRSRPRGRCRRHRASATTHSQTCFADS